MPRVYHVNNCPKDAVYIGRPSEYGNPYVVEIDGNRQEVMEKYILYLNQNEELQKKIKENLVGKDLACWCCPKPCHGDVILKLANENTIEFN